METFFTENPDFLLACSGIAEAAYMESIRLSSKLTLAERMKIYAELPNWPKFRADLAAIMRHHPDRVNCISYYKIRLKAARATELIDYLYKSNQISLLELANSIGRVLRFTGATPEETRAAIKEFFESVRSAS